MAKTKQKSSWETTTGFMEDFGFKVEDAWFGVDEESDFDTEKVYLFLRGDAYDNIENETTEDHVEKLSIGKGWEVVEEGAEVEHPAGKTQFHQNSALGHVIDALVGLGNKETEYLASKGEAYQASTFENLDMQMIRTHVGDIDQDDGGVFKWYLNLPTSLKIKKAKKGGKGKAPSSKSKKPVKVSGLRAEVATFMAEFETDEHVEFVDQVLDDEVFPSANSILDDDDLHADVLDPESDMWVKAHK